MLSIIMINYKNYNLTINCINSIQEKLKSVPFEIIVVDNNSENQSFEILNNKYSNIDSIKVIDSYKNGGFSYGNNLGAKHARYPYLLFLNNDTLLLEDNFLQIIDILNKENLGVISCAMVDGSNRLISTIHDFNSLKSLFLRTYIKPIIKRKHKFMIRGSISKDILILGDWVSGAFMLMRKEMFQKIGGWNEEYFLYMEDIDLCQKLKKLNIKVGMFNKICIRHLVRGSGKKTAFLIKEEFKSQIRYYYTYNKRNYNKIRLILLDDLKRKCNDLNGIEKKEVLLEVKTYEKKLREGI